MSVLQAWLVIGIPGLVISVALFLVRSPTRALVGYGALLAAFGGMAAVDRVSGAVFGGVLALLYAAGRGGQMEREQPTGDAVGLPDVVGYKRRRGLDTAEEAPTR